MRLSIHLIPRSGLEVRLPRAYHHFLQSAVYGLLSEELADFLHGPGFLYEKRSFRLFVFSTLRSPRPPRSMGKDILLFDPPLSFILSSPVLDILEDCAQGLLAGRSLRLGNNDLVCSGVEVAAPKTTGTRLRLHTCSPITCYSTLKKQDGQPYAVYYEPQETAFAEQITANLRKKHAALRGASFPLTLPLSGEEETPSPQTPFHLDVSVPLRFRPAGKVHRVTGRFSPRDTFLIKGWEGTLLLEGPTELLQLALDAGLGAKNSSGWGCVELAEEVNA